MSSVDVKALVQRQSELAGPIERAVVNLKKVGEANLTKRRVNGRLDALRTNWKAYRENHARIINIRDSTADKNVRTYLDEHEYFKNGQLYTVEEQFLEAQEYMETRLDVFISEESVSGEAMAERSLAPQPGVTHHGHRLPQINIPTFSGNARDWISFRDLFFALIGSSKSLTNVEKLHYLKTILTGAAAQRVESIALSHENFLATWNYLSSVYDDKRMLVNNAMRDFIEAKPVAKTSGADLDRFISEVTRAITALETLGQYNHHCDAFIVFIVVSKLDANTIREWEESLGSSQLLPTWVKLMKFLEVRARSLLAYEMARPRPPPTNPANPPKVTRAHSTVTAPAALSSTSSSITAPLTSTQPSPQPQGCSVCGAAHYIASCPTFRSKPLDQKNALVNEKRLCYNCLGPHKRATCRSQKRCQVCSGQHHTLIHQDSPAVPQSSNELPVRAPNPGSAITGTQPRREQSTTHRDNASSTTVTASHAISRSTSRKQVLLTTALVRVQSTHGIEVLARALIDTGSELSFISESLVQLLQLSRERVDIPLMGIGDQRSGSTRGAVSFMLRPHFDTPFLCRVDALTLPKLTGDLPGHDARMDEWTYLQNLQLADPGYATPGHIDIILGADIYGQLLDEGPTSSATLISNSTTTHGFQCSIDRETSEPSLHDALQNFWVQEEVQPVSDSALSPADEECEAHFRTTHSRDQSGRYIARLPFKASPKSLGDSRKCAARMLSRMHQRFLSDSTFKDLYAGFLMEYEQLGHMQLAPAEDTQSPAFFLPHHGVIKESSTTTKLRVVFNGSARTSSGHSLNNLLHTGSKLQIDLSDVILRWQRFQFAFAADIEKRFRQILVHPEDWHFQQILWSPDASPPAKEYQLTTVTYGLGPAPFIANRVLRQLVADEGSRFPLATDIICRSTYVDDVFGGADTLSEARRLLHQLDGLCHAGGFQLQKWTANYSVILSDLAKERLATSGTLTLDSEPLHKALGIVWKPTHDCFEFSGVGSNQEAPFTKRKVLSRIAQFFDPLGWLAPVSIRAKILMQDLWLAQTGWDETLVDPLLQRWLDFLEQFDNIPQISIPRWLGTSASMLAVELHGFSDASEHAMAAVVYVRVLRDLDDAHIAILGAKTKVAPLKRMTVPRLELTAAALLTRQVAHIRASLDLNEAPVHLWTDSTITLTWIQGHPSRWKDYVRNRVTAIHEAVPNARWHHVPGTDNPADCASRGLTPQQLKEHHLWWKGPPWLARHSTSWPASTPTLSSDANLEEKKKVVATVSIPADSPWELLERYSTLTRLLRITATCRRFFTQRSPLTYPLTPQELNAETHFWVKTVQHTHYEFELRILAEKRTLPSSNALNRLIPFLDSESGLLRLGGRLRNALLDPDAKHPLILPKNSRLTTLLIAQAHERTLHGGTQVTLAYLRRNYWIMGGRTPVRSYILRCVRCARQRGAAAQQLMGQLPVNRSTPSRPFLHAGVDYAGPLTIKTWRGRAAKTYKGYIVLFVCFSTSAIHLETVSDYSAEGFLAAFKRFVGRRGICATLTSDCGTNLVGADNELRKLFNQASKEVAKLSSLLANDGTEWRFNPPSAPHFGGKWEAGVKSVKFHLRRVIGDHSLTFEELSTLLVQIEAVLNSRPLCPLSDDSTDVDALTPGHFLIGAALSTLPEPSLTTLSSSRLSRWQLVTQMLQSFWTRWSSEYLQRFQAISKWHKRTEPVVPGSMVLVIDERYPPSKWPLARVTEIHPGADGLTRVVTVKTRSSTFKRPIVKLCPLPIQSPDTSTPEI